MSIGRALIAAGLLLACLGLLFLGAEKLNLPLGRLPGDIVWKNGSTTVYVPILTCLLLSLAVSAILWLFGRH